MALKHVTQVHYNGCFIAALAMLIGKTYEETFKLVFPDRDMSTSDHAVRTSDEDNHDIGVAATKVLEKLGLKSKKSTYKKVKSLPRYARKNVLIIVRWSGGSMCHAVIFDAETKKFLDPSGPVERHDITSYQRNLDSMYYVEQKAA